MLLLGLLPTAVVLLGIILWLSSAMYSALRTANEHDMEVQAAVVAAEIERGNTRAVLIAQVMAVAQQNGMFGQRRQSVAYAREVLASYPELTGAYFGYEPGADGRDGEVLDSAAQRSISPALDASGRFIPYWFRDYDNNEQLRLEPLVDMETSLYYQGCKDLFLEHGEPRPMLTEPYVYEGKMIVEQTFPIVVDGEFKGIAGVDRALSDIEHFLHEIKQRDGVDLFLVSRGGRFVAATTEGDSEGAAQPLQLRTRDIAETPYAALFGPFYQQRSERSFVLHPDPVDGERHYYAASPVATGEWLVVLRKSEAAVLAPIRNKLYTVFVLVALGLVAVIGLSLWITTTTSTRIRRAVAAADRVALGDVSVDSQITTSAQDETALLSQSFNRLVESYREITEMCVAIAHGDFSRSFAKRSDADRLADALNEMSEKRRLAEDAVLRARDAAEDANRSKSEFLAKMSHELRTPMNAIIGYSEMLEEEAEEGGQEEFIPDLQKIRSAGKHLLSLINDILDLSKVEAGKMDLHLERFDIAEVIDEVASTIRPLAVKNRNHLEVDCPDAIGSMHSDVVKLRQGLFNLLSNACKFTEEGTVRLSVERQAGDAGDRLFFRVSDSGIGMTAEQIGHIFEAFGQADSSTTRRFGGTGLGLTITKRFCEMLGGGVAVESEIGSGSTFSIELPAESTPEEAKQAAEGADPPRTEQQPSGEGPLVLVIDDEDTARDLLTRTLLKQGFSVGSAASGEEGLRLAKDLRPVAITLDVMMPGLDGWAVLRQLKSDPDTADIPVVMVTILRDEQLGFALGASEYLTKPVDRERLLDVIASCATGDSRSALVVDDDPDARAILTRQLERESWSVREAENGRVALERLAEESPGLILLDLMMPEMDGFEFIRHLRANEVWRSIPVVVITAKQLTPEDRAFLEESAQRVIGKGSDGLDCVLEEIAGLVRDRSPGPA